MDSIEDPWPTLESAVKEAPVVAEHARKFFGDALKSGWIYGSRAREDHHAESDLDVLLVRTLPDPPSPARHNWPFVEYLDDNMEGFEVLLKPISIHSADPHRFQTWDTMFFRGVREDGIRIL